MVYFCVISIPRSAGEGGTGGRVVRGKNVTVEGMKITLALEVWH
jgi:hypothetical protein